MKTSKHFNIVKFVGLISMSLISCIQLMAQTPAKKTSYQFGNIKTKPVTIYEEVNGFFTDSAIQETISDTSLEKKINATNHQTPIIRKEDVQFYETIWEDIDGREKKNRLLLYEQNAAATNDRFIAILINALVNDSLVNVDQTQMTTLGSVARWFSGGTPRASNRSYYESGTIPWAVIGDIQGGTISETANSITQSGLDAIGGRMAGVGSIIVSMYGTVGKSALVTSPIATNQAIAWGEPDLTKIRPDFLLAVLESKEQELITRARGATQQNINREIIRSVEFPLPKLEFQDQVCAQLQAIREVTETAKVNLSALRSLRAHALTALVSGIEGV